MNKDEKRSLISFITLYTISSLLLMSIIAILYYNKELEGQKKTCQKDLQESVMAVEMGLMQAKMNGKKYIFCPLDYILPVALFDANKTVIASNQKFPLHNYEEGLHMEKAYVHLVKKLKEPIQNIYYISAEDASMQTSIDNLKYLIFATIFISSIFIAFIGYLLSKLLLKPVKEKIAHIDHFIKDSAHEINTPVTALLMSVSALKKKGLSEEKLLRHITISSKQISDIYNSLSHIAFSDIQQRNEIVKFDLKTEVQKSITFYAEIAQAKQITIQNELNPCYIEMDRESASKLVNNLLSNAVKYSHHGKIVTVTLKDHKLTIEDRGIGISKKDQEEILKRYKRGTDAVGGFGIGLDIVNEICKEYDLTLTIQSQLNQGSTFQLDFSKIKA
ncbi:MAG: HAMP domain-containing histidine kinase [Epsilonproteobacteria bacterium]|nr:HAMP domain-containing histidine kinase [Campylobacterota bacterium]